MNMYFMVLLVPFDTRITPVSLTVVLYCRRSMQKMGLSRLESKDSRLQISPYSYTYSYTYPRIIRTM